MSALLPPERADEPARAVGQDVRVEREPVEGDREHLEAEQIRDHLGLRGSLADSGEAGDEIAPGEAAPVERAHSVAVRNGPVTGDSPCSARSRVMCCASLAMIDASA